MAHSKMNERGLIIGHFLNGNTPTEIANKPEVSLSRKQIAFWIQRFEEEGYEGLKTRPRAGRPKLATPEQDAALIHGVEQNPLQPVRKTINEVVPDYPTSLRAAQKMLNKNGLRGRRPAKKCLLTAQAKNRRLQWALANVNHPEEYWEKMIYVDEKTFRSNQAGKKPCWRRTGQRYDENKIVEVKISGRVSVGYFGAIWGGGPIVLAPLPPRADSIDYEKVLNDVLLPHLEALFGPDEVLTVLQDNASIHTARVVTEWFEAHPRLQLKGLPAYSPDLNPMEHIWADLVKEWETRNEPTKEALMQHVDEIWLGKMNHPEGVRNRCRTMPRRIQAVIDAQGGHTKY